MSEPWTPFNNRILNRLLTDDERADLREAGKDYGFLRASPVHARAWEDIGHPHTWHPDHIYRAKAKPVFTLDQIAEQIRFLRDPEHDLIVSRFNTADMLEWLMGLNRDTITTAREAAFINALAEEGTREELVQYLQEQWNETRAALAAALEAAAMVADNADPDIWDYSTGNRARRGESETGRFIRALITDRDRDALAAHVAKARAEDAVKIDVLVKAVARDRALSCEHNLALSSGRDLGSAHFDAMDEAYIAVGTALAQIGAKP